MTTSTTEETITISRAEYEEYEALQAENTSLQEQLAAALLNNEWLMEQLKLIFHFYNGRSACFSALWEKSIKENKAERPRAG